MAAPPLDSPCDGPVTYPGDTKILIKSSNGRSGEGTNYILRIKEQETRPNLHEHDDDDDEIHSILFGKEPQIVHHVSKNSVSIFVD